MQETKKSVIAYERQRVDSAAEGKKREEKRERESVCVCEGVRKESKGKERQKTSVVNRETVMREYYYETGGHHREQAKRALVVVVGREED